MEDTPSCSLRLKHARENDDEDYTPDTPEDLKVRGVASPQWINAYLISDEMDEPLIKLRTTKELLIKYACATTYAECGKVADEHMELCGHPGIMSNIEYITYWTMHKPIMFYWQLSTDGKFMSELIKNTDSEWIDWIRLHMDEERLGKDVLWEWVCEENAKWAAAASQPPDATAVEFSIESLPASAFNTPPIKKRKVVMPERREKQAKKDRKKSRRSR